jgi:subtilisin-like proprotein convertase family protein
LSEVETILRSPSGVGAFLLPPWDIDLQHGGYHYTPFTTQNFNGQDMFGTWQIIVQDTSPGESGSIRGFTLTPTIAEGDIPHHEMPEPATLFLLGAGMVGTGWWARRRRA